MKHDYGREGIDFLAEYLKDLGLELRIRDSWLDFFWLGCLAYPVLDEDGLWFTREQVRKVGKVRIKRGEADARNFVKKYIKGMRRSKGYFYKLGFDFVSGFAEYSILTRAQITKIGKIFAKEGKVSAERLTEKYLGRRKVSV